MGMQDEISTAIKWDTPSVNAEHSLRFVIEKMAQSKASALVVKMDNVVVGIISDSDLLKSLVDKKNLDEATISELMSPCDLITENSTINPCAQLDDTESVENALKVLDASGTHNLLITSADDNEAGIVSIVELLEAAIS